MHYLSVYLRLCIALKNGRCTKEGYERAARLLYKINERAEARQAA